MQMRQRISAATGSQTVETTSTKRIKERRSIFITRCNQEFSRLQERTNLKGVYISLPDVLNFPQEETDFSPHSDAKNFKAYRVYISFAEVFFKDLYNFYCASRTAVSFSSRKLEIARQDFPDWLHHLDIAEFWLELYESYPFESPLLHCQSFPVILDQTGKSTALFSPEQLTQKILKEDWSPCITLTCMLNRLADYVTEKTFLFFDDLNITSEDFLSRSAALSTSSYSLLQEPESPLSDKISSEQSNLVKIFKGMDGSFFSKTISLALVLLFLIFLRVAVGLGSYSGEGERETGFGDYEAHRHWMELTLHSPVQAWYGNTPEFPISWWPLDYPPLSAYHAYIFGKLSALYESPSMLPVLSRGYETISHKYFMRWTIILSDLLFMFSGTAYYWFFIHSKVDSIPWISQTSFFLLFLSCPVFVLVDHGHFQYNCVALGLLLWSICFMAKRQFVAASVAFMLSLLFKQTMLYYAPSFFFMLLGLSLRRVSCTGIRWKVERAPILIIFCRLFILGMTVIGITLLVCLPFLYNGLDEKPSIHGWADGFLLKLHLEPLIPLLHRLFPFHRGVYEDYVSNIWVLISPIVKSRSWSAASSSFQQKMILLSSLLTCLGFLPSVLNLAWRPTFHRFLFSLLLSSLSFFLFSWQVHEKAIALPLLPALLLFHSYGYPVACMTLVCLFSLVHLLQKDNLLFIGGISTVFWLWLLWECLKHTKQRYTPTVRTFMATFAPASPFFLCLQKLQLRLRAYYDCFSFYTSLSALYFLFSYVVGEAPLSPTRESVNLSFPPSSATVSSAPSPPLASSWKNFFYRHVRALLTPVSLMAIPPSSEPHASSPPSEAEFKESRKRLMDRIHTLRRKEAAIDRFFPSTFLWKGFLISLAVVMAGLCFFQCGVSPPLKFPYFFVYLSSSCACLFFLMVLVVGTFWQFSLPSFDFLTHADILHPIVTSKESKLPIFSQGMAKQE